MQVPPELLAAADLIVAGSPVFAFSLPSEKMRETGSFATRRTGRRRISPTRPCDPGWMRCREAGAWPRRSRRASGGRRGVRPATIEKKLASAGYRRLRKAEKYVVTDKCGPLREGELERARAWGQELRAAMGSALATAA